MVAACLLLLVYNPICLLITRQSVRGRIREQIQCYDIYIFVNIRMYVCVCVYIYVYILLNSLLYFISSWIWVSHECRSSTEVLLFHIYWVSISAKLSFSSCEVNTTARKNSRSNVAEIGDVSTEVGRRRLTVRVLPNYNQSNIASHSLCASPNSASSRMSVVYIQLRYSHFLSSHYLVTVHDRFTSL